MGPFDTCPGSEEPNAAERAERCAKRRRVNPGEGGRQPLVFFLGSWQEDIFMLVLKLLRRL